MEELRRELRKDPTHCESLLWERLRRSQLDGKKFRREHSVGSYVLDFCCPTERLAVEVDGSIHDLLANKLHDAERDLALSGLGIKTIRVRNEDVEADIESVIQRIAKNFHSPDSAL